MPDFNSETANLWKKIQKQALTKQIDIIEIGTDDANISTLVQAFLQTMSVTRAFEPVLTSSNLSDHSS